MSFRISSLMVLLAVAGCTRNETPAPEETATVESECCCEVNRSRLIAMLGDAKPASNDWPMYGGAPNRNMANAIDKNIPADWSIEKDNFKNIRWHAQLGSKSYGGPVVADGKVFIGTNNDNPRDPNAKGDKKAVVMAFNEADGKYLWQIVHEIPADPIFSQANRDGLFSSPAVDGKRLYYVTPGCEVICASTDGKVQWQLDMMKELHVVPFHTGNCSPLVVGDLVLVMTGNGIDENTGKVASAKAPSFLAVNKTTGKVVWQSDLPGANIIEGQWSNPTLAKVNGKDQVIFPGGDSYLYGLDLASGKMVWKFNCQPQRPGKDDDRAIANYMISTAVTLDNKAYIGLGVYPGGHPTKPPFSYFLCIDTTRSGDVSAKTLDAKDPKNRDSALVWSYGGKVDPPPAKRGRKVFFDSTISTCAIHEGLVYISEENGYLHCLDAKTGQKYWEHDFKAGIWGSPYYVDGKVYIGTEDGEIVIFAHGKKLEVLGKIDMGDVIHSTPVVARGVLYVMTKSKLYAIAAAK